MKNCPFCKALIEDSARFCIYCMSPLEEKQEITPKKSRKPNIRNIALAAAVIIIAAAVWALFAFLPKNQSDNNTAQTTSDSAITADSTAASVSGEDNSTEQSIATEIVTDAYGGKIIVNAENGKPIETNSSRKIITQPQPTANNARGGTVAVNTKVPTAAIGTSAANTAAPNNPTKATTKATAKATTKARTTAADNVTYTYRAAKYGDDYSVSYPIDNCVVITGVSTKSSSGTYTIPETLGGKKVIAIMCGAFSGEDIHDSVKKVIVPATVKTIWDGAFSLCRNMTDIYFCGSSIFTESAAFADDSIRSGTLTIHCSYDCSDRNLRYYRNTAADYGAEFDEWNG